MLLMNLIHTVANLYLPRELVGYIAARGVLRRYRQGVMIERDMMVLPYLLDPGDWAIDIGAAIGDYTIWLAHLVGNSGRVFAFEPLPWNVNKLKSLVQVADLADGVEIHQAAVGEESGTTSMFVPWGSGEYRVRSGHIVSGTQSASRGRQIRVPMDTLDRLFPDCPQFRFVKIDTEGMELPVLRGGLLLLRRWHPHLLVEISPCHHRYGYDRADLVRFLEELGYQPLLLSKDGMGWSLHVTDIPELARIHTCNCYFADCSEVQRLLDTVNSNLRNGQRAGPQY
ncbi:MAG: FkbM family methyltransferase [Chloroflexota bacterium]